MCQLHLLYHWLSWTCEEQVSGKHFFIVLNRHPQDAVDEVLMNCIHCGTFAALRKC